MRNNLAPGFLIFAISILFILPACSNRSSQINALDERLTALEVEHHNFMAKQESLNAWEAARLSQLEAKHPDLKVPPPPAYVERETVRASAPDPQSQTPGEVVHTLPGEARIEPAVTTPATTAPTNAGAAQTEPAQAALNPPANTQPGGVTVYPVPSGPVATQATPPAPPAEVKPTVVVTRPGESATAQTSSTAPVTTEPAGSGEAAGAAVSTPPVAGPVAGQSPHFVDRAQIEATGGRVIDPNTPASPLKPGQTASAPKPAPSSPKAGGEKGEYASALSLIERGKNADGRAGMDAFMGKYPQSSLTPNALYWKGESFYGEKRYDDAVLVFRDVVARFPQSPKAADAMLKIGMSYQKMGDNQNARFYLEQLLADYPNARSAALAKKQLAGLP